MKSPPKQIPDDEARDAVERFIKKYSGKQGEGDESRRRPSSWRTRGPVRAGPSRPHYTRWSCRLRICLVTPFSWSQPHDVNEHVAGVADELRERGHSVTVLAPSNRAADLRAGRRALRDGADAPLIALGPPCRSRGGAGSACRSASARTWPRARRGDSTSSTASSPGCRASRTSRSGTRARSRVASFFSPERLGYPPAKAQREKLLGADRRARRLVAGGCRTPRPQRFPGEYRIVPAGVDAELFRPATKRQLVVARVAPDRAAAGPRGRMRALRELPGLGARLPPDEDAGRTARDPARSSAAACTRAHRPRRRRAGADPRRGRDLRAGARRPAARLARGGRGRRGDRLAARASRSSPSWPPPRWPGSPRTSRSARSSPRRPGAASRARRSTTSPPSSRTLYARPRRGAATGAPQAGRAARRPATGSSPTSTCTRRGRRLLGRGRRPARPRRERGPRRDRGHRPQRLRRRARGRRARPRPRPDRDPGRGGQDRRPGRGDRALPVARRSRGACPSRTRSRRSRRRAASSTSPTRSTACTRSRTRRRCTATSADIDVFEVYNARLLFEAYNDEALRFARKYNLTMGAGSDAHVLPGLGDRRPAHARVRRPGGVPAQPAHAPRSCAARSRSRTCSR